MNCRINKKEKFTQIDNEVLRDKELTMEGLALLVRLLSRPDNWTASIGELIKNGKDKSWTEGAIKRGFKNLKECGYAKLVKIYNIDSKVMQGSYYEIFEDTESGKLYPSVMYVDSNKNEVKKQTTPIQTGLLSDTSGTPSYIYKEPKNKENKNIIISDEQLQVDKVSVKMYEQNTDGNCTFPILDSTEPIYKPKSKETEPKGKSKPKENQPKDELKSKFRVEFESLWYRAGKPKLTHIGYIAINKLYEVYGYDKGCFIRDYIIEMYGSNEKSIAFKKNHENAIEFYKDPNNEQPRFLNDYWKTMERFSRPNAEEPVLYDFPTEVALYAAFEWYYKGKGLEGVEIVKAVREKIKEINHPRFNKY